MCKATNFENAPVKTSLPTPYIMKGFLKKFSKSLQKSPFPLGISERKYFFSKWGNKIHFPVGNSEGDFSKLNIVQKQISWFVQNNKDKKVSRLGFDFTLSQWEQVKGIKQKLNISQKQSVGFVQVDKVMRATFKNMSSHSIHNERLFKKIEFWVYFQPFPFPYIWRVNHKLIIKKADFSKKFWKQE